MTVTGGVKGCRCCIYRERISKKSQIKKLLGKIWVWVWVWGGVCGYGIKLNLGRRDPKIS